MIFKIVMFLKRKFWMQHYKNIKFAHIGKNTVLDNGISFIGEKNIYIGDNVFIGSNSTIQCYDEYKNQKYTPVCKIGNNCTFTRSATIYCAQSVSIGDGCMIGSNVLITDENHGTNPSNNYRNNLLETKPVVIGENTWIGDKVVILPGVEIGSHSIIGAGAVVTKSLPAYSICAGNPAKIVKTWNKEIEEWERIRN